MHQIRNLPRRRSLDREPRSRGGRSRSDRLAVEIPSRNSALARNGNRGSWELVERPSTKDPQTPGTPCCPAVINGELSGHRIESVPHATHVPREIREAASPFPQVNRQFVLFIRRLRRFATVFLRHFRFIEIKLEYTSGNWQFRRDVRKRRSLQLRLWRADEIYTYDWSAQFVGFAGDCSREETYRRTVNGGFGARARDRSSS